MVRRKDPEEPRYPQSAVVPYRRKGKRYEVLMVTSSGGGRWVVPKGLLEPGLSPRQSAAKEALEEAGIEGRVLRPRLGRYRYRKWGGTCEVEVFVMRVDEIHDDWDEAAWRRRAWVPLEKAAARVREPKLRALLRQLPKFVKAES